MAGHTRNSLTDRSAWSANWPWCVATVTRATTRNWSWACCIAAGIFDDTGKLVAGLSISAPAERLQDEWIKSLVDTAASISEALGYEPPVSGGANGLSLQAETLRG